MSTDNIPQEPRKNARRTDPATSREAAYAMSDKRSIYINLLAVYALKPRGLTAEEAADIAGYGPEHGAWKRVSDLKRNLLLADKVSDGVVVTRAGASGRQQNVLVITRLGRLVIEEES